jgi:hypothetical protein
MADGIVTISTAQLGYLLEGIDWQMPQKTWRRIHSICSLPVSPPRRQSEAHVARTEADLTQRSSDGGEPDALIARLKLEIEKLRLYGARSERKERLVDQLEMQRPMRPRTDGSVRNLVCGPGLAITL